jgi:diacylglycerol kinase family enzyme
MWLEPPLAPHGGAAAAAGLWIVMNPASGDSDAQQVRAQLAAVLADSGRAFEFVPVAGPRGLQAAGELAAAAAARQGGVLVAVGGDGTINTLAGAAWRHGCALGVVPQGTFNYFARAHGIPQDTEGAVRALLRGRADPVQVGQVGERLFLVNASLGLYPQVLQDREAFKAQLGRRRWVAALSGLATLLEWRRQLRLEIVSQGQRITVVTPTLFVGNNALQLAQVGIVNETAQAVGEGRLAAVVLGPVGRWKLLWLALRGALGRLGEAGDVRSFNFESLQVQRVAGMRRVKVAADGEIHVMAPPLRFAVAARPLWLVRPCDEDRVAVE